MCTQTQLIMNNGCPRGQRFGKKSIEESWQMTMKSIITSPFVLLWLEDAVNRRWLKTEACVFLCSKSSAIGDKVYIKLH